jgi:hypothetical protein
LNYRGSKGGTASIYAQMVATREQKEVMVIAQAIIYEFGQ